jgi:hypothetical protein
MSIERSISVFARSGLSNAQIRHKDQTRASHIVSFLKRFF